MPLRECDLQTLPDGQIASITQSSPEEYDIGTEDGTIEVEYKIIVGGPNPQSYRINIWNMILAFVPDVSKNEVNIPILGSFVNVQGRFFVARNIKLNVWSEAGFAYCRKWLAVVTWESAKKEKDPQNQAGEPTTPDQIDQAQATVRVRPGTEEEPVEFAQFLGFMDGTGDPKTCSWKGDDEFCQPLRGAFGKVIPVMNSAGVRFDPGLTRESGVDRIVVSKPFSFIPFGIQKALRNKVNCDRFFILEFRDGIPIFGIDVAPKTARVSEVTHTFEKMANGFEYPVMHVELAIKSQRLEYLDEFGERQFSDDFGWEDIIANRGSSMLIYPEEDDFHGGKWGADAHKNNGGSAVATIGPENSRGDVYWLDCNGLPLVPPETPDPDTCALGFRPEDITYLVYMKYAKIKFASNNFPGFLGNCFFNTNPSGPGSLPAAFFPNWASSQDLSGTVLASNIDFDGCDD